MEWSDEAIVLSWRRHGENSAVITVLSRAAGRHAGMVRGGGRPRLRAVLQPGNRVQARWRARLAEHLGTFECELVSAAAVTMMNDPRRLAGLAAACAVAEATLPEREAHPVVFDAFAALLDALPSGDGWPSGYVKWELGLLAELGFGLDLSRCAATGGNDQLAYVSPRTGRAVSLSAGEPYRDRLLALPPFLLRAGGVGRPAEIADGLALTGFFLDRHVFVPRRRSSPPARERLAAIWENAARVDAAAPSATLSGT